MIIDSKFMVQFLIQGDLPNIWWQPLPDQLKVIYDLYEEWKRGLGQGGMAYPGTEISRRKKIGDFTYLIHICGSRSYMQNLDHVDKKKRLIYFLPEHQGSTIGEKVD
jgi:hypothetical protein